jgi:hypothetical protein
MISIAQNHNMIERLDRFNTAQHVKHDNYKIEVNEVVTHKKKVEYVNLEGHKLGKIIDDRA